MADITDINETLQYFQLRPLKAAKVSEISEITAASSIPPEERVNFHIGHPVWDTALISNFQELVLNLPHLSSGDSARSLEERLEESSWEEGLYPVLSLLGKTIENSVQYMPRGGYSTKSPNRLANLVRQWFIEHQQEPLEYDLGTTSDRRELIFANGGIPESLRVLFHTLAHHLRHQPCSVLAFNEQVPGHLRNSYSQIQFLEMPSEESAAMDLVKGILNDRPEQPQFLILGEIPSEQSRRTLRRLSLEKPLFFIETSNAPNHLSMAREAGLLNRVLRFITPAAIDKNISECTTTIMAGNADYIEVLETIHFQLKSSPSAAEIELLTFLLEQKFQSNHVQFPGSEIFTTSDQTIEADDDTLEPTDNNLPGNGFLSRVEQLSERRTESVATLTKDLFAATSRIHRRSSTIAGNRVGVQDPFTGVATGDLLEAFFRNLDAPEWLYSLEQAFLSAFIGHHPEYEADKCSVVSGSARTALSLIGFHCGIREVVVPDLSWTYHHCFEETTTVSLGENLSLDADAIITTVRKKMVQDPHWHKRGAVALNNPHNASGQVFNEEELTRLVTWLLRHEVFVIDDLAYQNVAPSRILSGPKTIRQIVTERVRGGYLRSEQAQFLITVHSLSKTDCFAGGRLAVTEILHPDVLAEFQKINATIQPNSLAILISYLFYRNHPQQVQGFWTARNRVFYARMEALEQALKNLPDERNPYHIQINRPSGAMYPRLIIEDLPPGISLDWLATGLAARGIGLVPLTTFAKTDKGYELGRKSFRLTLGGADNPDALARKTRRVLIELNRIIADEAANYTRKSLPETNGASRRVLDSYLEGIPGQWVEISEEIHTAAARYFQKYQRKTLQENGTDFRSEFVEEYLPERLRVFSTRMEDRVELVNSILSDSGSEQKERLRNILEKEFYKESLEIRDKLFRRRLFDRTVHPTQMYSLHVDVLINEIIEALLHQGEVTDDQIVMVGHELVHEYFGGNVPILSVEETDELRTDLRTMIETEEWTLMESQIHEPRLFSFWGDWDGSTRPSGQGHRLVAAALTRNVTNMAEILSTLLQSGCDITVDRELIDEIRRLENNKQNFWDLLNKITSLTNQLEKRYQQVLPFNTHPGKLRRFGMWLHIARDPMAALWQHNDRLERKMVKLRRQRRENLEYYFSLNKRLRKTLHSNQEEILKNLNLPEVMLQAGLYRNLLDRFVLTPRIHQKMILAQDQFTIDTTVHNIMEINELAGKYGNPGMVLALQISMSDDPEAFISLDRKLRSRREELLREDDSLILPPVYIVPLFEEVETVHNLENYLDKVWEYAVHSRRLEQTPEERFREMVCELFFAGSDLSQQIGQASGAAEYKAAKHMAVRWLAQRGLVEHVRIKFGSGEPMQRQGGYYDPNSGMPVIRSSRTASKRLKQNLDSASRKSVEFARSPLRGVWASGEFRTFQSNIFEHIRRLSARDRAELFYHVADSQRTYERELARAAEPLLATRLHFEERGLQELEMLTVGRMDSLYQDFQRLVTENFRQILYGREEDVVGIHVISYFIARTTPPLRDRPVVRPSSGTGEKRGQQIVERIAQTLPLSRHGSLLRAIGHNRAQTMIMGVNQVSTGVFRALRQFAESQQSEGEGMTTISERILPRLPVHDILHTLRIYHDVTLKNIQSMEPLFPAGNSAFYCLREDTDSIVKFISMFQKELLRRQGLNPADFFIGQTINMQLLPTLRPDIAVLLQPDLFNTSADFLFGQTGNELDESWMKDMEVLLELPEHIRRWREKIWDLIEEPIKQQVESFVKLALAIHTLSDGTGTDQLPFSTDPSRAVRLGTQVAESLREVGDDSMRQFLSAVVQYLTQIPETMSEVPIDVIRALRDVERIVKIEEQALGEKDQGLFRYYLLQIARLAGENG